MPDPKMLSGELSLWSAVLMGQGEKDSSDLLLRADNLRLELGQETRVPKGRQKLG